MSNMEVNKIKKTHIYFLLFALVISGQFYRLAIIPIIVTKAIGFIFSLFLVLWSIKILFTNNYIRIFCKKLYFIPLLLIVIFVSTFMAKLTWGQTIVKSLFVIYPWAFLLLIFYFAKKNYTIQEIYKSLTYFSYIFMLIQIIALLLPFPIVGNIDGELDVSRGVSRIRMGGVFYLHLWGFLNLGLYCKTYQPKYFYKYILVLIFVILSVSRQHILFYSLWGLGYLLLKLNYKKKIKLIFLSLIFAIFIIPKTSIYKNLVEVSQQQIQDDQSSEGDVRRLAITYFLTEFPNTTVTKIFGNCQYNMDSKYGQFISELRIYFLSDIGFIGIYIYYGILGIVCFIMMYIYILRIKIPLQYIGLKLFMFYLFCTNIFSHSFDIAQVGIAICMYFFVLFNIKNIYNGISNCLCFSR